jgi:hypothetical protein
MRTIEYKCDRCGNKPVIKVRIKFEKFKSMEKGTSLEKGVFCKKCYQRVLKNCRNKQLYRKIKEIK